MDTNNDNIRLKQIIEEGVNIYGSREKIRNNLINHAKRYLNISTDSDISKASYLAYLIDMLSILSSNQVYYQSKIYNEFFIVSALMNESVQNLAKWIGYTIPKAKCATANVLFTIPLKFSTSIVNFSFPKYFQVRGGGIPFTIKSNSRSFDNSGFAAIGRIDKTKLSLSTAGRIIENSAFTVRDYNGFYRPIYFSKDGQTGSFSLEFEQCRYEIRTFNIPTDLNINQFYQHTLEYEGQVADLYVYVCSPTPGQFLNLSEQEHDKYSNIESFNAIDPIYDTAGQQRKLRLWQQCINGIYTISSTSEQYDWCGYYNKGIITFGNGILGKQPTPGSLVVCVLKITEGSNGNIINNIITEGDILQIDTGNGTKATIDYSCVNNNAAFGGQDILSTSELKNNAIVNLKARKRLVTDDDYNNITTVVEGTTLSDCTPILKRSDIKINDISLYFILNYFNKGVNEIVPTRNVTLDFQNIAWSGINNDDYLVSKHYIENVGPDRLPFQLLFNMTLNKTTKTVRYEYTATNVQGVTTELEEHSVQDILNQSCYMNCTNVSFSVDYDTIQVQDNKYPVRIKLNVNNIPNRITIGKETEKITNIEYYWKQNDFFYNNYQDGVRADRLNIPDIVHFKAIMITKWGESKSYDEFSDGYSEEFDIEYSGEADDDARTATKKYKSFEFTIPAYTDVPNGKQRYEFYILAYVPKTDKDGNIIVQDCDNNCKEIVGITADGRRNDGLINNEYADANDRVVFEWKVIKKYYSDVIINQDLSSCMSSSITVDNYHKGKCLGVDPSGERIDCFHVHEVPMIYKPYYDDVMYSENSDFELNVLQKLLENVNFSNKRMMSDFTNIKFADCYGSLTSLRYNKPKYVVESRYIHTPWWNNDVNKIESIPKEIIFKDEKYKNPYYLTYEGDNVKATKLNVYDTHSKDVILVNEKLKDIQYRIPGSNNYVKFEITEDWKTYSQTAKLQGQPTGFTQDKMYLFVNDPNGYVPPDQTEPIVYYIINEKAQEFSDRTTMEYLGHIAIRVPTKDSDGNIRYSYDIIKPELGDIIKIKDELDTEGFMQTCVWNGRDWINIEKYTIPLHLNIRVHVDEKTVSTSDEAIIEKIKSTISEYYNSDDKVGLNRELDRSEIIKCCRSIEGVQYVDVLAPEFDLKFNYEVNDLTQKELLDFTPQYVGFRTLTDTQKDYASTSIHVEVIRK